MVVSGTEHCCIWDFPSERRLCRARSLPEVDATLGGVAVNLLEPLLNVVETVHVGDIVNDADAVSAAVVRRGNGAETLLSGGVPLFPSSAWQSFGFDLTCVDIQSGASRSFHPARWF